jgi:hypothetical protein
LQLARLFAWMQVQSKVAAHLAPPGWLSYREFQFGGEWAERGHAPVIRAVPRFAPLKARGLRLSYSRGVFDHSSGLGQRWQQHGAGNVKDPPAD